MKNDAYVQKITEQFIKDIKENNAPWMKPWKASQYIKPRNPVTKSVYHGINALLLESIQSNNYKSNDPRWFTFLNIKNNGYHLKAGSLGTAITFLDTIPLNEEGKFENDPEKVKKNKTVRKIYFVFHASQIENLPPLEKKQEDIIKDSSVIENAENLLTNSNAKIFHDSADLNYYNHIKDEIHLTPKHTYNNLSDYYCTALHELSHWTGHPSRLNREFGTSMRSDKYAQEELRAEIASYLLCKELDLDFNPQNSVSYVSSWLKFLKDSNNAMLKSVQDSVKIKDFCFKFSEHIHSFNDDKTIRPSISNQTSNTDIKNNKKSKTKMKV